MRARVYLNSAVAARALRSGGFVADSVLVADIMSHGTADGIDLVQGFGKKSNSSCPLGHGLQSSARAACLLFSENADRINCWTIFFLQTTDGLFQRFPAGIVFPIGHYE